MLRRGGEEAGAEACQRLCNLLETLFLFSCSCAGVAHKRNSFDFPIESFVKFEYTLYNKVCEPENSNTFSSKCFKPLTGATGSGSIISKSYDGAYILTAAHMCKIKVDPMLSALMIDEEGKTEKSNPIQ